MGPPLKVGDTCRHASDQRRWIPSTINMHPIIASAFTVAELGAMVPSDLHSDLYLEADTEADARAKTLIYLLERSGRDRLALPE